MLSVGQEPSVLVLDVDVVADDVAGVVADFSDDVDDDDIIAVAIVVVDIGVVTGNSVVASVVIVFNPSSDVVTKDSVATFGIFSKVVMEDFGFVDDDDSLFILFLLSILSTTISTLTITGISCICTLFTVSESSSSMVLMNSHCSD